MRSFAGVCMVVGLFAACGASEITTVGDAPLGRPDARAGSADARLGAPDAKLGAPDAKPGTPDAKVTAPPDAKLGTPDAKVTAPPDAKVVGTPDARPPTADAPPSTGIPGIGAHALKFFRFQASSPTTATTPAMNVQDSGSTIIVGVGRGDITQFSSPLSDNKGNDNYVSLDGAHAYHFFPQSGTATYALTGATGGSGFTISTTSPTNDEITIAAVEVTHGSRVVDSSWVLSTSDPSMSASVTTDGPATLVAFWWGEASGAATGTALSNNGFNVIESQLIMDNAVQCAMAVKTVDAAGTYDVTWTATPDQGAQLWLVAVE